MEIINEPEYTEINPNQFEVKFSYLSGLNRDINILVKAGLDSNLTNQIETKIHGLTNGKCTIRLDKKWKKLLIYGTLVKDSLSHNHGAIQELSKSVIEKTEEISQLNSKTNKLQEENDTLRKRIEAIEKHLGEHFFQ